MPKRVLITGAAGYLGSVLCETLLVSGYVVTAVDNLMYGQQSLLHLCHHERFNFIRGDARDKALLKKCVKDADVVIPLAAVVGAGACQRDPWLARAVNFEAVRMLLGLVGEQQRIVFPTTNSGYGTQTAQKVCTEDTLLEPISLYGRTKVDAENEVLSSNRAISLRLATVFGTSARMRLDLLVNHFTYAAVFDGYLVVFEKDFARNYVHIRDVADCFMHCMEHGDSMVGRAFNVGLDEANLTKEELALAVKAQIPKFALHFDEIGKDPDKRDYIVCNRRLQDAGFRATRSIDAGIGELIKSYSMLGRQRYKNV